MRTPTSATARLLLAARRALPTLMVLITSCQPGRLPPPEPPPAPRTLIIAATTDVHGRLRGYDYYQNAAEPTRGLTRVATIVDSLRGVHPGRVILVDAGDLLQGNPLTYVAARSPVGPTHPVID